jgi:hypothetical protein
VRGFTFKSVATATIGTVMIAVSATGCGSQNQDGAVRRTAITYFSGALTGNGAEFCSVIGGDLKQTFQRKGLNCEREIKGYAARLRKLADRGGGGAATIKRVKQEIESTLKIAVSGTTATATYGGPYPGRLAFQKIQGRWYVVGPVGAG